MSVFVRSAGVAAVIAAAVCAYSCGGSSSAPSAPTVSSLTVTGTAPAVGASAQFAAAATLSTGVMQDVTSQAGWQSSNASVATVSASGLVTAVGAGDVDIRATYQNFGASRAITIAPLPCRFSVSPASVAIGSAGGQTPVAVTVTQGTGCAWTASSSDAFVTIASGAPGTGNGVVVLSVAANGGGSRTGSVTIAGQTVTIVQDPGANCATALTPTGQNFDENGPAPGTVSVTAPSNCNWTATANASFLSISSGSRGSGNGTVAYSVANNDSSAGRSGTISIGGLTLTVTQDGRPCPVTVSPTHIDVDGAGCRWVGGCLQAVPITVTMTGSCAWASSGNADWLGGNGDTGGGGGTGTGSGAVNARIFQNNSGQSRNGTLTVAGQAVTVTQTACAYSLSPSSVTVASAATSIVFTATGSGACLYNFIRDTVFLGVGFQSIGYTGANQITVTVPENTSSSPRSENLRMYGRESNQATTPTVASAAVTQSGRPE